MNRLFRWLLRLIYRVEINGLENLGKAGDRVLIVANHVSFLDPILLAALLPGKLTFAVNTQVARRALFRPVLALATIFPMDPTNPLSTKALIRHLKEGRKTVIFPEGRITVTGALMKIYDGAGLVADKADATVLPIRIDGAQFTWFSRLRGRVRQRWFPKITLTVLAPRKIAAPAQITGRERRKYAGEALGRIMTDMMFVTSDGRRSLFQALLDARQTHGGDFPVIEDIGRKVLTYDDVVTRVFAMAGQVARRTTPREIVGVLLPSACGTVITFMACQASNRVPAMLNFTIGVNGVLSACEAAGIRLVLTSRRFIEAAKLQDMVAQLGDRLNVVYLEDMSGEVSWLHKLLAIKQRCFAGVAYRRLAGVVDPDDAAVVLFTSGSEGVPKGVVLSHANLLANINQLSARVDFSSQDVILNVLPLFHSFGLMAGTLLPLLAGVRVFFYPSPLHYRVVPEIAYDINATILFGTNTFLSGYAKHAHPYDFYSVRYVFAGAERLQEETRRLWSDKFGVRIFEGYGATETSPALAINTPMQIRAGSVGRFLPGIDYHLEPVEGVANGGRLHVHGPNVMRGYMLHDRPGEIVPAQSARGSGWYDTGDIVEIDGDGFVYIKGRVKRFAKIGGEMVSLTAAEELVSRCWPNEQHAVIAVPDAGKGEILVLVTERSNAERSELIDLARAEGIGEINVPKKFVHVKAIPLLGTGKTDYRSLQAMLESGS